MWSARPTPSVLWALAFAGLASAVASVALALASDHVRNPILLVGTRLDPNTPLVNARIVKRRLGNAVLPTHEGYGHLSIRDPSTCVMRAIGRYLVSLATPRRGTVCRSDRLPFDPSFGLPFP